jgi:hypothetical protein
MPIGLIGGDQTPAASRSPLKEQLVERPLVRLMSG